MKLLKPIMYNAHCFKQSQDIKRGFKFKFKQEQFTILK